MANRPAELNGKSQENPNGGRLDDWTESLGVVDAVFLIKTLSNQPGFVMINGPISLLCEAINPFISNDLVVGWPWTKGPGAIGH